jgi:hypothetical protein
MDLMERTAVSVQRHPWEIARGHFFRRLLERMGTADSPVRCLDIGAGDAWFAQQMIRAFPPASQIVCWDINYSTEDLASLGKDQTGLTFVAEQPSGNFDGILMLDVIEHIDDDLGFVRNVVDTVMAPEAWALVSVPAYQGLFTTHDTALKHYRRYSPSECTELLRAAGLTIEAQGGLFHSLLAARGYHVVKERLVKPEAAQFGIGGWHGGCLVTRAITLALESESRLSLALGTKSRLVLPGLSFWAFCRRVGFAGVND